MNTTTYYLEEQAKAYAAELNRREKDEPKDERWTYKAVSQGNGLAIVEIYDETGEYVGNM